MPKKKENLLGKIVQKDYNNELEKVIETKDFDEDVKNLLLSIFYKVEISYKDYKKVKRNVESKQEYIEKLLKIIQENCEIIKTVKTSMRGKYNIVGLIDDNPNKRNYLISGVRILGNSITGEVYIYVKYSL